MPRWSIIFVRIVDRLNYGVGRFAMYLLFVLMAILMWSAISKTFFNPSLWTLEAAQFAMVAYYILGGPYSMQMGSHVRMDLFYARWSDRQRAWTDAFTVLALIFYLGVMLWGAFDSFGYSLGLKWTEPGALGLSWPEIGRLERSPTAWRPYLWPIKLVLCLGFFLMLLQSIAYLIRDIATIRGETI
ncbi:TRAP transporter small permease subunit [Gemmobacter fulvus]|uniref:TRAP transporter small permease protein n=1 Tax=Gemmobacter fulvus TaxID=2840474 RepID=A0A975P8H2_9RHOB|nr:TRAP transporter small permease subunit [Gemmobacter fulvus]MBT9244433.1 TRAP transporter small permease subunit [Gemmobacter fulvus]QWK91307.1 TRAP transporter small permease subunit [Gemmobacter fulvus]